MSIIYDIETRPVDVDTLKTVLPAFEPEACETVGPHPMAGVTGETPEMKNAVESWERAAADAEYQYWQDAYDRAALAAETATVCAIGATNADGKSVIHHDQEMGEAEIIDRWWKLVASARKQRRPMIGFNSNRFDVPFLVRRSWYLGIQVPGGVFNPRGYLNDMFVDLLDKWQCGDRRNWVKLDTVCRAAGIQGKPDNCHGKDFHRLLSDPARRPDAISYLENDLMMTTELARKMQII